MRRDFVFCRNVPIGRFRCCPPPSIMMSVVSVKELGLSMATTPVCVLETQTVPGLFLSLESELKSTVSFLADVARIVASVRSSMKAMAICVATVVALGSCMVKTQEPTPPLVIDIVDAGSYEPEPYQSPIPMLCSHRDHISFDGGSVVFDVPRPCVPIWFYRELGDPQ